MTDISASTWSSIDAQNNANPPAGAPENWQPSSVNDTLRSVMAGIRRSWERSNAFVTTSGVPGAYVYTTSNPGFPASLGQGEVFSFKADKDSIGNDTLAINTFPPYPLFVSSPSGLLQIAPGEIKAGQIVSASFDSTLNTNNGGFQVIGFIPAGSIPVTGGLWTPGSVAFASSVNGLGQDPNLFWSSSAHRLGIGTNTPRGPLDVSGQGSIFGQPVGNAAAPTVSNTNLLLYEVDPNNWAGMGADTAGNVYWATGTGGVAARMFLNANSGNLGIANLTPAFKLDVVGDINTSATLRLANTAFANHTGNYQQIFDAAGNGAIFLGNTNDATNYYRNTSHVFGGIAGSPIQVVINNSGLRIAVGSTSGLQLDNGAGGNIFKFASNNAIDPSFPSMRSDGTNLVLNSKTNGGLYLQNDITGGVILAQSQLQCATNVLVNGLILASEGGPGAHGYSFQGDGAFDTGMFSPSDGVTNFYNNGVNTISLTPSGFNFGVNMAGPNLTLSGSLNTNGGNVITGTNGIQYFGIGHQHGFSWDGAYVNCWVDRTNVGRIVLMDGSGNVGFPGQVSANVMVANSMVANGISSNGNIGAAGFIQANAGGTAFYAPNGDILANGAFISSRGGTALNLTGGDAVVAGQVVANGRITCNADFIMCQNINTANDIAANGVYRRSSLAFGGGRGARIENWSSTWDFVQFTQESGGPFGRILDFNNNVDAPDTTFLIFPDTTSDARLKTNIRDTEIDALAAICATPVRAFEFNEEGQKYYTKAKPIGLVAQEVEETMPDVVVKLGNDPVFNRLDDLRMIADQLVIPYLFRAIQQLNDRIDALKPRASRTKK